MKVCKIVFSIIYILLIVFCFFNSLQSANVSSEMSGGITNYIVIFIEKILSNDNLDYNIIHKVVRKVIGHYLYHVVVGVIGIIVYLLFLNNNKKAFIVAIIVSLMLSIISELLQLFAEGRSFSAVDILINYSGFLTGIVFFEIVCKIKKQKKQNAC